MKRMHVHPSSADATALRRSTLAQRLWSDSDSQSKATRSSFFAESSVLFPLPLEFSELSGAGRRVEDVDATGGIDVEGWGGLEGFWATLRGTN